MTRIEAFIRPSSLEGLVEGLDHEWIAGITLTEVKGHGRQKGHREICRGVEHVVDMLPKLKIEIAVPTPLVPRILHQIERSLRTGRIGDGKVVTVPLDEVVRIRTGERGEEAL